MRRARFVAAFAVCLCAAAGAADESEEEEIASPPRVPFKLFRQDEDWSQFPSSEELEGGDWFDHLKNVSLSEDGEIWASFGGHARIRGESWSGFNFGAPAGADDDDMFVLGRVFAHADVHFGDSIRVYAEGKSALLFGGRSLIGGERIADVDALDLFQGFADIDLPLGDLDLTLRPGRQMLDLGAGRLVGPGPWRNTFRSWDSVSAFLQTGDWQILGFAAVLAAVQQYSFNDGDPNTRLSGIYAEGPLADAPIDLDLYWLHVYRDQATFNGTSGREDRHTVGARGVAAFGDSGVGLEVEAAHQFGEVGDGDIEAWMATAELGYSPADVIAKPRLWVGADYASGDRSPGGDVQTFNQLFPRAHRHLGWIDAIARQNIIDARCGVTTRPTEWSTFHVAGHWFWLANRSDALYNLGGGAARAGGVSDDRYVGAEIDLQLNVQLDHHSSAIFGYSHFFASSVLDDSGFHDDIDFAYLGWQFTF